MMFCRLHSLDGGFVADGDGGQDVFGCRADADDGFVEIVVSGAGQLAVDLVLLSVDDDGGVVGACDRDSAVPHRVLSRRCRVMAGADCGGAGGQCCRAEGCDQLGVHWWCFLSVLF